MAWVKPVVNPGGPSGGFEAAPPILCAILSCLGRDHLSSLQEQPATTEFVHVPKAVGVITPRKARDGPVPDPL